MEINFKDDYARKEQSEGQSTTDTARKETIEESYISFGERNHKILVDKEILQIINEGSKRSNKQKFLSEQERVWAANIIKREYKTYKTRKMQHQKKIAGWIIMKVDALSELYRY